MLSASITLHRAPKNGKDGEGITILSTSVMYAISSSGVTAPSDGWSPSVQPTTTAKPYLWTRTTVTYSQGDPVVSYSVSRQGTDGENGTNFTPRGTALGHYANFSDMTSSVKNPSVGDVYILDMCASGESVNASIPNPCVATFMDAPDYSWYANAADIGDAYNVDGRLLANNGSKWVDFGEVKGADGKDGQNLTLLVTPGKFVLDAGENGEPPSDNVISFYYYGFFGTDVITDLTDGAEFTITFPNDCNLRETYINGVGEKKNTVVLNSRLYGGQADFNPGGLVSTEYTVADKIMHAVASSAYFLLTLTYKGFVVQQRIDVECNMALFNQNYVRNIYEMKSDYAKTEYVDGKERTINSTIRQTATELNNQIQIVQDGLEKKAGIDIVVTESGEEHYLETDINIYADYIDISAAHQLNITSDGCMTISTSNFKLSKDGTMSCTNGNFTGTINATSGYIGGFRINENFIGSMEGYNMYLTNNYIHFGSVNALASYDGCTVNLGERQNSTGGENALEIMSVAGSGHNVNVGGYFSVMANNTKNNYCAALELQAGWASGAGNIDAANPMSGNHAILIHSGDVPGLRPSFVRLNKSKTLTDYNHTVDCYNTSEITLTLPSSPLIGQEYVVLQEGAKVNISGNGKKIKDRNGSDSTSWNSNTYLQESHLFFNGEYWIATYFN